MSPAGRPRVVGERQQIHCAAIVRGARPAYDGPAPMAAFHYRPLLGPPLVVAALALASHGAFAPPDRAVTAACNVPPEEASAGPELDSAQRILAAHLARRYQVARSVTERVVAAAWRAADEVGLDPLTVLAVVSVESRFNPVA